MIRSNLAIGCLALLAISCSDNRLGGNSVETESDFTARVLPVDSILPVWNKPSDSLTVATIRFDSTNFDFSKTLSDGSDLRLVHRSYDSTPVPFTVVVWDKPNRIGRLQVRLDSVSLRRRADLVLIGGGERKLGLSNQTATWEKVPTSQQLLVNSVLVDNFESSSDTTLLPTQPVWAGLNGDSGWITGMSHEAAGLGRTGKAMRVGFKSSGNGFVVFQTKLVANSSQRNLRSLDSLEFWARGKGKVMATFDHNTKDTSFKAWTAVVFDSTKWVRVRIRPQDLDPNNGIGGNRGWLAVRDSVTHLTFIAGQGSEVWFDDIRLYGIDRDDLR